MEAKKFWKSKTFWTNVIGIAAIAVQAKTGFVVDPALQAVALGIINTGLRAVTSEPIEW
nr:hypothetical protein 8 [bacterium]